MTPTFAIQQPTFEGASIPIKYRKIWLHYYLVGVAHSRGWMQPEMIKAVHDGWFWIRISDHDAFAPRMQELMEVFHLWLSDWHTPHTSFLVWSSWNRSVHSYTTRRNCIHSLLFAHTTTDENGGHKEKTMNASPSSWTKEERKWNKGNTRLRTDTQWMVNGERIMSTDIVSIQNNEYEQSNECIICVYLLISCMIRHRC